MKKISLLLGIFLVSSNLYSQELDPGNFAETIISPQFFITIIAGVILALGFQFILTALSVAAGISAIGDVKKSYVESKNHSSGKDHFNDEEKNDNNNNDGTPTRTLITTGFGIWSTLTVAVSLFGATALAMNLSLVVNPIIGVTLALVIWATFFILLFYLESKVVNTMIGGLINTATAGLRSSASAVKDMFTPSEASKMEHMADHTIDKVRKEFKNGFDSNMLDSAVNDFFTKFDKKVPNYDKVKKDIEQIVEDSVDKSNKQNNSNSGGSSQGKWMAIQSVLNNAIGDSSGDDSEEGKSKTEQLNRLQKELKEAYGEGDNKEEKAQKVIAKLSPADEEQVGAYMSKIKEFISQDGSSDMDTEEMGRRIKEIVKNPKVEANKIGEKLGELDRDAIVAFLSENTPLEKSQLEKYAGSVEKVLLSVQGELSGDNSDSAFADIKKQAESIVNGLTGNSENSGFDFAQLSTILQGKMDDQKENLDDIKSRLSNTNKDDVIALVTNNTKIDKKDINNVVDSFEDAKNKVLQKVQNIEDTARGKLEVLERKAVIQAEHARETAAAAAWWLVVSAVFSACAAIGGSMVTLF
jgi:nucleoid DNA-binding protein